ncbi:MAG TPA: isocitrate lyase/phosphoenolpyruvate mutase family protein [Longimicrobiales bacterium]|nr:isocitrate lyase/phosphoenolpyruvate mutase family protein [Longimicrobiales bacterium]
MDDRYHSHCPSDCNSACRAPGLVDIGLIARLAEAVRLPLNIMVGDTTPPVHVLAEHGVARVSHGPRPYLLAMQALEAAARTSAA